MSGAVTMNPEQGQSTEQVFEGAEFIDKIDMSQFDDSEMDKIFKENEEIINVYINNESPLSENFIFPTECKSSDILKNNSQSSEDDMFSKFKTLQFFILSTTLVKLFSVLLMYLSFLISFIYLSCI